MEPSRFGLDTEAGRELRIKHYEGRISEKWALLALELRTIFADPVWGWEDLEAYCDENFGMSAKVMRLISDGNFADSLHFEGLEKELEVEESKEPEKEMVEKREPPLFPKSKVTPRTAAERAKAYRERRKHDSAK